MGKNSNKFVIATFVSEGTPYEDIINKYLLKSCQKLGLPLQIAHSVNCNNWYRNVAEKPLIIRNILSTMDDDTCLVFLDADCTIEKYPILFEKIPEEYDIAFHMLDWNVWYGYKQPKPVTELLTGTMFFRNRPLVKQLCMEWYETAKITNVWEQKILEKIIKKYKDLRIYQLPLEYIYMNKRPRGQEPLVKLDPVIIHYQKSRELKKVIM